MIEDDLALLGVKPAERVAPSANAKESVAIFVDSNGIMPGRALSIPSSALYRMYLEWAGNAPVLDPWHFSSALGRLGFSKRKEPTVVGTRRLLVTAECAKRLRRWLELNPQPYGWTVEFQSHFWRKKEGVP